MHRRTAPASVLDSPVAKTQLGKTIAAKLEAQPTDDMDVERS